MIGLWHYIYSVLSALEHGPITIVYAPIAHFALSATVGWLVYWLTSITLSRGSPTMPGEPTSRPDFYTHRLSLLLALSSSVFVHILQDYTLHWF